MPRLSPKLAVVTAVFVVFSFLLVHVSHRPTKLYENGPLGEDSIYKSRGMHGSAEEISLKGENMELIDKKLMMQKGTDTKSQDPDSPKQSSSSLRISCWIMTSPGNLESRSRYIQKTWAKRCDKVVFISSETNKTFPTVGINVDEGRKHLTEKTLGGYHYVYHNHFDDCDWFFKGDDDTYLIVENLRHFLEDYNTNDPVYFGHQFKTILEQGYSSGGSGLVLSKEALRRFDEGGHKPDVCRQTGTAGDVALGQCMQSLGVKLGNSTDSQGRSRFHCLNPKTHLSGNYPQWYYRYDANGSKKGILSMSDYPISFHYVHGSEMLEMDYLLYYARVYDHDDKHHN